MNIITLTLNPAYDIHCHIDNFLPYHENLADITALEAGGKGINISRALTVCKVSNTALTVLCSENSENFKRSLEDDKMNYIEIPVNGRIRENITIHTSGAPETRISFAGFTASDTLLDKFENALDNLNIAQAIITFTGRVPSGISIIAVKDFILKLTEKGHKVVIDSKSFTLDDLIELKPWLIKPNEEEISEYLGKNISSFEDALKAAKDIYDNGIQNVMISLGSKGAMLCTGDGIFTATPPKIDAVSTIGAGDSSIAGFLAAQSRGSSSEEKLRNAVAFGTAACLTSGTKPPLPEDVNEIIKQIKCKKLESF